MSIKLYVIPGHGQGDPGAGGGGFTEADLVRRLATRIVELGGGQAASSDHSLNCYANNGMLNWSFPDGAQVVELHMDSADPSARGAHVIIKQGLDADEYDRALAERLSAMFPGRANTIVRRGDLRDVNQAAMRGIPYRLVEHGFISNTGDREYFLAHIDDIARVYLEVFGISGPAAPAEPQPSEPAPDDGDFHGGTYRCTVAALNVRDSPSMSGTIVATYSQGQTVDLDDWYTLADGYVWGRYTGASSGLKRYVAVGPHTGKAESDDYLVKA